MYVFWHDHISDHGKTVANAHQLEDSKYQIAVRGVAKLRLASIATPGDEKEASRAVITLEAPGMKKPYTPFEMMSVTDEHWPEPGLIVSYKSKAPLLAKNARNGAPSEPENFSWTICRIPSGRSTIS